VTIRIFAAVVALAAVTPAAAGGRTTAVTGCHISPAGREHGRVVVTSARNMTCRAAARDLGTVRVIRATFRTRSHFRCARLAGSMTMTNQWRCARGAKAYRFDAR
jgi:hypothetical protein